MPLTMKHHVYEVVQSVLESQKSIHEILTTLPIDLIATGFELEGFRSVIVDQAPLLNQPAVMHAFYQSCELPAGFAFSWQDLHDQLVLLAQSDEDEGLVLLVQDFAALKKQEADTASSLLNVLADVAAAEEAMLKVVLYQET